MITAFSPGKELGILMSVMMCYGAHLKILNPYLGYILLSHCPVLQISIVVVRNDSIVWTELLWTCYFLYVQVLFP